MHAVIKTGGKQYRVTVGQRLKVEKLALEPGEAVEFDQVLLLSDEDKIQVGTPLVSGAKVAAKILEQGRGEKIRIIKMKRRKHHMKKMGHRQYYTEIEITGIQA